MRVLVTLLLMAYASAAYSQSVSLVQDTTVKLEAKTYFDTVETKPAFKGNLGQYLGKNLRIPQGAKLPPKITAQFWIDTLGRITYVEILDEKPRAPVTPLEKEVVRVVKAMPRWEPGTYNGRKVTVKYSLPIMF